MKKLLLLLIILISIQNLSAQILQSEDFDSLTIGAVGTDATGTIPTNNYYTLSTNYDLDPLAATTATNAGPDNFQIADYGAGHGKVLQIDGTNGDKGRRNMWQGGLADQWAFRDPANNKIQVEFDLYTGDGSGLSNNTKGLYIYDATTTTASLKILGGFVFNTKTLILQGIGYYTSATAPIGNYGFFLGPTATNLILPANQWVKLIVSFNKTTGQIVWKGPSFIGQVVGAAAGVDPDKVAFISRSGSAAATGTTAAITNAASTTAGFFDNLIVTATDIDLLGVEEITAVQNTDFVVYPNPTNNLIKVSSKENASITAIAITDIHGRIVKNQTFKNLSAIEMNVSDLANGIYMMNIASASGNAIQKLIKN
ncbi:T9SS type A sorting domain-containing protein [Flavobacterium sp.]|uniref:T9SS type A sorting domain-containing protein n=1 Tax=Flavobacterium sp. TaxID=239 RepID=UPI002869EDE5|nr:T9SS type A sorting domain-containing protein [Flavobacterium sp.]